MKDVKKDLADRMAMLHARYLTAFTAITLLDEPPFDEIAKAMENGLWADDRNTVQRVRSVVDPADLDRPEFWATKLGRLLFAAGGYNDTSITRTHAALLLGCSRQWIHELVSRGTLQASPSRTAVDREVYVTEVQNLLKGRLTAPPAIYKKVN